MAAPAAESFLPAAERPWFIAVTAARLFERPDMSRLKSFLPRGTQVQMLRPSVWCPPRHHDGAWMAYVAVGWTPALPDAQLEGATGWIILYNGTTSFARVITETIPQARSKAAMPVPPSLRRVTGIPQSRLIRLPTREDVVVHGREEPDWSPRSEPEPAEPAVQFQ